MLNFLYCLDSNYNQQFLSSLQSLLDNVSEKINCYVIHKNPESLNMLMNKINFEHQNLYNLEIYKFNEDIKKFPNLEANHISEATYYRFFIDNYLDTSIENIIYLDCDIICLNSPEKILYELITKTQTSEYTIAASTEYIKSRKTKEVFNRLEMESNSYFNAGVMVINVNKWVKNNTQRALVELMNSIFDKVDFWDQDVMNCFYDGKYLEISKYLNFKDTDIKHVGNGDSRSIIFLHYAGSNKPWTIPGCSSESAMYFHNNFYKAFNIKYLLKNNYRKQALKDFLEIIFTFRFLKLTYPLSFIKLAIKSFTR
tara:strand:- start:1262 stop:2197 length:936 start_codon:yes stop_codon:yes gene_type:complete